MKETTEECARTMLQLIEAGLDPEAARILTEMDRVAWELDAALRAGGVSRRREVAPKSSRCGARRKRDGEPCEAAALHNGRCRYHGGLSTGPKTPDGRAVALANLRQYRSS